MQFDQIIRANAQLLETIFNKIIVRKGSNSTNRYHWYDVDIQYDD